jgi:hypothetical protein
MKKKPGKYSNVEYTDGPGGDFIIIEDYLPPPDQLVFKESNTRVTINLKARDIEYFKREAKKYGTQYQKLIRNVLDMYVTNASAAASAIKATRAFKASKAGKALKANLKKSATA